ncbi:hydroxyethylthiazole kinase [Legionella septentrionalis]|uniref:hydroxyethylthiazole kinase n=1 Tax=Legionella septentrionalis TaxID=2498109 RepID=UPI000F8C342C|nr:hydroxyethylthiazole kinase [Legionella septentrionalis]RUR10301.1 hydroxyethylthiazole kinase [Legionella septentrionalis]
MTSDENCLISQVQNKNPLILNITNYVSMEFVANGLLCMGASPVMSHSLEDASALAHFAAAVVINIGTLDADFMELADSICQAATQKNIPLILDPVGAGATAARTTACWQLLDSYPFAVIRGNASEIKALAGRQGLTKGVDSTEDSRTALVAAQQLARQKNLVVVASGATDLIVHPGAQQLIEGGSALMPLVTGSGCLFTAVVAAFCAVHSDYFAAAVAAARFYGRCGELAARTAPGPGSFKMQFLDHLYQVAQGEAS